VADTYPFAEIEPKWHRVWKQMDLFRTRENPEGDRSRKFYYLDMFPYPSGELHMGHLRNYIIGDVLARYMAMRGRDVLHPMGWDAFGLPAENAAIERGIHPAEWTQQCIEAMKRQFDRLGISYDWSREITACLPDYYRWTQWLFLQLYKAGLAYRKRAPVNWCPKCGTVLANEQVVQGECERCATAVEKRNLEQWFFASRKYADRLLEDLDTLTEWPERVVTMQRNWIGRSEGVEFDLAIEGHPNTMSVFTTRIDTVYGITFMVLAPEHPLVEQLTAGTEREAEVRQFCREAMAESEIARAAETEKRGMFIGAHCLHPLTGDRVPIYVANYVLMEYGTGAIMAVPAHDQRDLEFVRQHGIPVRVVIQPPGETLDAETMTEAYVEEGVQVNSGPFDGMGSEEAKGAIADYMEDKGIGRRAVNYRLRDWCISRQRYWGAPIPIVYCERCGIQPVPEAELPVLLPRDVTFRPDGQSPLKFHEGFLQATCPECGGAARRETDTMDTFVCSSWYYLRFASPHEAEVPFDRAAVDYWLPVDKYVGGVEHAVMHLYYARFITKALYDQGHVGFTEPFRSLFTQGMLYKDGAKMSKSKGNVVSPDEICEKYGADTGRVFILFMGPPEQDAEWSDQGVEGAFRFLNRVWRFVAERADVYDPEWAAKLEGSDEVPALRRKTHQTVRKVTDDIERRMHFNTAVSALMELANEMDDFARGDGLEDAHGRAAYSEAMEKLALILSPFAPHLADELWSRLGKQGTTYTQPWPSFDPEIAAEEQIEVVVQINGKVRERLTVPATIEDDALRELALSSERIKQMTAGKSVRKVIVVPGKLVNVVVG
jgi:leucyl-tRNA synthetase